MNKTLFEYVLIMLERRLNYYNEKANEYTLKNNRNAARECHCSATAYQSAHDMLVYAMEENFDCLKEFDYFP